MEPLPQGTSRRKSESLKGRRDDVLLQPRAEADGVSVGDGELEDPENLPHCFIQFYNTTIPNHACCTLMYRLPTWLGLYARTSTM